MNKTLLQKNTRFLLTWLPLVLIGCSVLFYVMLRMQVHHMQEKQLQLKQFNVWKSFIDASGNIAPHLKGEYDIVQNNDSVTAGQNVSKDTSIYYPGKAKHLPFETLTSRFGWNGNRYDVTAYVSSTEISHLIIKVFIAEAVILFFLMIAIVLLNRSSAKKLWEPFFSTMRKIGSYDITRNESIDLPAETGVTEFNALHKEIDHLINNSSAAYYNQKQFVENASHEMQTPLAIIRSKLELMINQPDLTSQNAVMLQDITEANDRLSQMNRTLLLMAKIENNQFPDTSAINLSKLLVPLLNNLKDHYDGFPELDTQIADNVTVQANHSLIDILLGNLVNNAIVHNIENGKIRISLQPGELLVANTGPEPQVATAELFERFKKGSHQSKTTGLGLSLVRQICLLYGYTVSYAYLDGWHTVKIILG